MLALRTSSGSNVTTPEAATPVDGYVLAWSSAANAYVPTASGGGSGTVTSVDLTLPASVFTVSGSPVTGSGTLAGDLITQIANTVFAGPVSGGDDVPTMRALVADDLPSGLAALGQITCYGDGTEI